MNGFTNINIRNISPDSMNRNKSTDTREWSRKLSDLISKTELFLKTAPEGSVWSSKRNNGTFQYYYVQPGTRMRVFIRQNDMAIARELAQKKYVFMLNKMAIQGMNSLKITEFFTEEDLYRIYDEAYYQLSDGLRILVKPWKEPRDVFLETWASQTYEPLEHMGRERTQVSDRGEIMGSKSEVLIGNTFNRRNIEYHYEKPLLLKKNKMFRPDFTLMNIYSRRELFWEHLGIVDNEHYASNAMKKLMIYEQNDIFINDRLILTYETANDPLNLRTINEIIDQIEYMLK